MALELIEINLGRSDCHSNSDGCENVTLSQIKSLILTLPWKRVDIGIGGQPFRFKWWKEMILFLSTSEFNFYFVDLLKNVKRKDLSIFEAAKNLFLSIEVKNEQDIVVLRNSSVRYETILVSVLDVVKNKNLEVFMGENVVIEQVTFNIKKDLDNLLINFLKKRSMNVCRLNFRSVICVNIYGDVFPCVALQYKNFYLGNIFKNNKTEIMKNYSRFLKQIKCNFCCQARSFSRYGVLNRDYLCKHIYAEKGVLNE